MKTNKVIETVKIKKYLIIFSVVVIALLCGIIGHDVYKSSESEETKIGFEDIGELATQSAYCTEVNVTDTARELFGMKIPFTQSKYIYSYDFVVKAGFDFEKIKWSEKDNKITVKLPEVKVLSNEAVDDSFKVFHEKESIFRQIKLEENIEAIKEMKKQAVKDAVENGLYENAKNNAEMLLTAFFGSVYDMNQYQIEFIYK